MKKKLFALLLSCSMVFALLAGCASSDTNENETSTENTDAADSDAKDTIEPVKVVLNEVAHSIFYAPMYIAIEEDYFADEGIDLELVTGFGVLTLVQK